MPTSIRKFLLINLLLAIFITTTLTAIGNYYLDEKDIHEHLDIIMAVSALSYQALLGNDLNKRPLNEIQTRLDNIPIEIQHYFKNAFLNSKMPSHYLNQFSFQVLDTDGKLLLKSSTAPNIPLTTSKDGFKDKIINNQKWRVFSAQNHTTGTRTVLADRYENRNELGTLITEDDLYIMLLTFPLSGLLIWIIIGRGLNSLDRIAEEVSNRAPSYLEPVNLKHIPDEIRPVIDELNQLFHRLQEGFDREKRFAADAAHELRTPLAAIKTQAQVALNATTLNEKNEALNKLVASVNRGTHVVQQLLTMSQIAPETESMNDLVPIDLAKLTQDVLATLAQSAIDKNIELEFDNDLHGETYNGNTMAISILIRNLVDNAIRYTHEGGRVIVSVYYRNNEVILQVKDDGPGIPDELRTRVFERFFRVLGSKSPGSGLGLGIVQQICDLHHARITLESPKMGTGLIVSVYFPI